MSEASESDLAPSKQSLPKPLASSSRFLTELEKRAIVAERAAGMLVKEVARRYQVDPATVWRVCKQTQLAVKSPVFGDWRSDMRVKAIDGVNAGLDCPDDPYKRANIGVNVLKGLGDFAQDQGQVNVTQLVSNLPESVTRLLDQVSTPLIDEGLAATHPSRIRY